MLHNPYSLWGEKEVGLLDSVLHILESWVFIDDLSVFLLGREISQDKKGSLGTELYCFGLRMI